MSAARKQARPDDAIPSPAPTILGWLDSILEPRQRVELRAFGVGGKVQSRIYPPDQRTELVDHALRLSGRSEGVYFVLNPIAEGVSGSAKDGDITRRRRILIDCDPARDPAAKLAAGDGAKLSATDAEKQIAGSQAADIWAYLARLGWPAPVRADSGNGWHLIYAVDLPNDDRTRDLVKAALRALAHRFDTAESEVDTVVFNASRVTKFYGTVARKGIATLDRPHRASRVLEIPDGFGDQVVSLEQLETLAAMAPRANDQSRSEPPLGASHFTGNTGGNGRWTPEARAIAYLQKCEPAVSGEKGHNKALKAACKVGPGFDLGQDTAFRLLSEFYNPSCRPPWSEKDLRRKVDEAYKVESRRGWFLEESSKTGRNGHHENGQASKPPEQDPPSGSIDPGRFNLTDLGNAERLVGRHGKDLRYCHPWKRWLVWDGRRWAVDNTGAARRRVRRTVRAIYAEASKEPDEARRKALAKWAMESEKRDRISSMMALAEAEEGIPILPETMDRNPWSFNCLNGTIDLRTGKLGPHTREDQITKLCPIAYDLQATCPLWEETLRLFFAGKQDLIDYFQLVSGLAISGVVRDHIMPVAYGKGANGKSTILGTLMEVFGPDYAMKCPPDMLMAKKTDSHPTDRADLFGKRLVVAIETEGGRRLNETMVKELTGADRIRARRMREDFWEFDPTHTLILATNHKPIIRGTDNGIWRRLRLIPFSVRVSDDQADKKMPEKLRAEHAGILAWCVRGCLKWQADGLKEPKDVTDASSDYRKEQDVIGAFLDECITYHANFKAKAGIVFARYMKWCAESNENAVSQTAFGMAMDDRGIIKKPSNGVWYLGIGLNAEEGPAY